MSAVIDTHFMFQEKILTIPDNVLPLDIETIYNWFERYNIAKVNNVTFHLHEEPEYYVEDNNGHYGYAVIYIDEWYDNTCACNFYEHIYNLNGKMVFDDPYYWEIEFYDYTKHNDRSYNNTYYNTYNYSNDVPNSPTSSEKDMCTTEYLESEEEEESENYYDDDEKDLDYVYTSTDEDEDYEYEYDVKMCNYLYKKFDKSKGKKQKTKNPEEEVVDDVVVVNNKNYMKRDKRKDFKNIWVRRLRQKHETEY